MHLSCPPPKAFLISVATLIMVGSHLHNIRPVNSSQGWTLWPSVLRQCSQGQCSHGQCSHLPLEGAHEEGEGLLTWSLPTFPYLVPTPPVFGRTTPPRVPTCPGRGLGVPGAVAGLEGCHFRCEQTGTRVTPHLSSSCPGGMSFSSCIFAARSWLEALLSHTRLCESVLHSKGFV